MLKKLKNWLTPTYKIVYAPERSERAEAIQVYKVLGNPANASWKSKAGNRLFTLPMAGNYEPRAFRADRVLSVGFAVW